MRPEDVYALTSVGRSAHRARRPAGRVCRQLDRPRRERLSGRNLGRASRWIRRAETAYLGQTERHLAPLVSRRAPARLRLQPRRRGRDGARGALRPSDRWRRAAAVDRRQGERRLDRLVARLAPDRLRPPRSRDEAYEVEDDRRRPPRRFTRVLYKLDSVGWIGDRRKHLFVVDLEGGERQLTDGDCENDQPAWSPDGSHIVFTSSAWRALGRRARRGAATSSTSTPSDAEPRRLTQPDESGGACLVLPGRRPHRLRPHARGRHVSAPQPDRGDAAPTEASAAS